MTRNFLLRFGFLRIPLAILELPTFVLLPSFYSGLGLSLASIGAALFLVRLLDAILDPLLGQKIDQSNMPYRRLVLLGLPFAAIGFFLSFHPQVGKEGLVFWLFFSSVLTYVSYSVLSIAYQAWSARLGTNAQDKARIVAWREGLGLCGVLLASALLKPESVDLLSLLFAVLAVIAALLLLGLQEPATETESMGGQQSLREVWTLPWKHRDFGRLLLIFVFNGVASAIPATLLVFFVRDVLMLNDKLPVFLLAYFAAGALGMPVWLALGKRFGLRQAWMVGMGCAILAFIGAAFLGVADYWPFMIICVVTGLTLGADLALPPALLAMLIAEEKRRKQMATSARLEASYFGLWSFATKANLALAAGLALPLLTLFGYDAQAVTTEGAGVASKKFSLLIAYAAVPCLLKLVALGLLWRFELRPAIHLQEEKIA